MRWAGLMPIHVKRTPPSAMTHASRPLLGPCMRQSRLALAPLASAKTGGGPVYTGSSLLLCHDSLSTPSPPNLPNLLTHNHRSPYEPPSRLEGIPTVERPKRKRHLLGRTVGDHIPGAKNVPPWYSKPRVKGGALGVHKPIG